jgi:outer membrane protein
MDVSSSAKKWVAVVIFMCSIVVPLSVARATEGGESPLMIRVRMLGVIPDDSSTHITAIGGNAEVDSTIAPDLDFTWFFTKNIAAELTLALTKNSVSAANTAAGNLDLGDVYLLPPTLTIQYHFMPDAFIRPYVGAGINYTVFFDGDSGVAADLDYDNNFGMAIQAGVDISLADHWAVNVDLKKIWLSTDVDVRALGTTVHTEVDIDPWLIGIGIAYRF